MEQDSSSNNAIYLHDPVATLQAIRVIDCKTITLPPEILNTILRLVKHRNSLLVCRMVNKTWNQYSSSILQSDYEISIHFKKKLQFSPHTDLKIVSYPLDKLPLLTSSILSSNFPCRNFLFQGVRIGENRSFHRFLHNHGDRILKLAFEECEFPYSCTNVAEEEGKSCYQAFVYWVMQKVPNLTHLYCTFNKFFANKKLTTTEQSVNDIDKIYFQQLLEFHFRPDDYYGFNYSDRPSIINLFNRISNTLVSQILAHSPNLKKYFSRPFINKIEELSQLLDGDNLSKLKNFALDSYSYFRRKNNVHLIDFVHENLSGKLALEELNIDITHLPFNSTKSQERRDRSCTYMNLTNQLLENNKNTLKSLVLYTYDSHTAHGVLGFNYVEPMTEKLQFPVLMPNVNTFVLKYSLSTVHTYIRSCEDFYNAIFFPSATIQRLNWTQILPQMHKMICWNFNLRDEDSAQFSKDDQNHGAPFDYKMPNVTYLKIAQSSNETIKHFGKVCPSVHHFIFWLYAEVCLDSIYWNCDKPLIFKDVIRHAIAHFPHLTKLEIELDLDVEISVEAVELGLAVVNKLQDDILAFLLLHSTVDEEKDSGDPDHTSFDLKAVSCLNFTISTKILDFTKQTFTLRDRRGNSCHASLVVH